MFQKCVLDEEKTCIECGECNRCDLDPNKICDNCCRCIDTEEEYAEIAIEKIILDEKESSV